MAKLTSAFSCLINFKDFTKLELCLKDMDAPTNILLDTKLTFEPQL